MMLRGVVRHKCAAATIVGKFRFPDPVRTRVGVAGDRLLLAADPAQDVVVAHPMRALGAVPASHAHSLARVDQP
ncbi:hypothetical protein N599_12420 [Saccharopolyspora erythraea D]|nr:hypothetical protein N599_12420 [Saccharopolyspora erythraea D]